MDPAQQDLTDYLVAVRRRWWLVLAATAAGVLLAGAVTLLMPASYQATTSVLVLPTGSQDANAVAGRTDSQINMDTEAQLVQSTAVARRADRQLGTPASPHALSGAVSVAVPPNSTVLQITYAAGTPDAARAGSHAFATAYLANRRDAARSARQDATRQLDKQIAEVTTQLETTTAAIGSLPDTSSHRAFLVTRRQGLSHQLNDLTNRRNAASTDTSGGGRIISDAARPTAPASPLVPVNLGGGALLGLIAGLIAALATARLGRRVRSADELPRYTGVPVLAELPVPPDGLLAAGGDGGRAFSRLRNELPADAGTVLVTGTAGGPAGLAVAVNLAAAFGRSGAETALLLATGTARPPAGTAAGARSAPESADPDASGSGFDWDPGSGPGWPAVVAGDASLNDALRTPAGQPHLRVLPDGTGHRGADSPAGSADEGPGSWPSRTEDVGTRGDEAVSRKDDSGAREDEAGTRPAESARPLLAELRGRAARVVVAAPDITAGPDAQTLAGAADAAILAVELGATHRAAVRDAAEQLRRVGTPLLGAVLLPRYPAPPAPPADTTGQPADEPTDNPIGETADTPTDKPAGENADEPIDDPVGENADTPTGEPASEGVADAGEGGGAVDEAAGSPVSAGRTGP